MTGGDESQSETGGRPDEAHELLGRQLRLLREAGGVTPTAAGRHIGGSASKISRIECGRCKVKEDDLHRLLNLYGGTDRRHRQALLEFAGRLAGGQWWDGYRDVVDDWFRSYLVLESIAQVIRTYEVRFIPGLLQTRAYAEAVVRRQYHDEKEVRRRVEVRMRRQHAVIERKKPHLWAVIDRAALDEAALPDGIAGPAVMREQIEFLRTAAEQPNVVIQILPPGAGGRVGIATSFSLLRMSGIPDVAYIEHIGDALFLDRPDKADRYAIAMNRLGVEAGEPQDAKATLEESLADIPG